MPINFNEFVSKIKISLLKNIFFEKSLIKIKDYILDVNKRQIKKNKLILKLTEREVDFLIHLNKKNNPISIDDILKDVWNYSFQAETHTIETHVHRLRKKFLGKFKDKLIQNNNNGYFS